MYPRPTDVSNNTWNQWNNSVVRCWLEDQERPARREQSLEINPNMDWCPTSCRSGLHLPQADRHTAHTHKHTHRETGTHTQTHRHTLGAIAEPHLSNTPLDAIINCKLTRKKNLDNSKYYCHKKLCSVTEYFFYFSWQEFCAINTAWMFEHGNVIVIKTSEFPQYAQLQQTKEHCGSECLPPPLSSPCCSSQGSISEGGDGIFRSAEWQLVFSTVLRTPLAPSSNSSLQSWGY
jgi:hypothetical protein